MQETIKQKLNEENYLKKNFHRKFLFIDDVSKYTKLKQGIELCIIQTDFGKTDIKNIKKIQSTSNNTEFWICTNNLSKENILTANKIGIKIVVSSPIDERMVEDFFNAKSKNVQKNEDDFINNFSEVANSEVMIVDDNPMNVELLEEILCQFNINISSFLKPKEAYQSLLQKKYDLFLLDVMMPDMSGFELAKKIQETPHNKNTPILFISALSDNYSKIKGYNLGSVAYIEKPFDVNIIRTQIFNILKNQKAQQLLAKNKEDFLAIITHDLKTPLRAGANALNLLLNENFGELEDDQHEIIEDILNSTKYMQDMVENILCKNKIERDQITLSKQVYPLNELIEHCAELTKYILAPKNQQIKIMCDIDNTLIPIDFLEMKRVIHNLIANASEYSSVGSDILIKIFEKDDKIGFFIQDYGKGIDTKYQEDVFSQYMTLAKQNKTVGSGLGLYITKKIIEAHGGEITLKSKVGQGTIITVLLPMYNKV